MKFRILLTINIVVVLSSCISVTVPNFEQKLSHSEIEQLRHINADPPKSEKHDAVKSNAPVDKPTTVYCPLYLLPNLPPTPELPLRELSRISPTNQAALDRLEMQHISDLRDYIIKLRQVIHDSHSDYLTGCFIRAPKKPEQ